MKKIIYLIAFVVSSATVSQSIITKNVGDFTILKVYNGIEVELIKSTEQRLEITGKKSEKVKVKNIDGTLKLMLPFSLKPENNAADGEVFIKVFYNKDLRIIDANEGATITGKIPKQNTLEVNSQERAFINLVVNINDLEVRASSGGIIKLTGSAKNQNVDVDLYGTYNGFNLKTKVKSTVKAGTGAKAEVSVGKTLDAKVSFGGSIFYNGNPKSIKEKKVVGGIIQKRN